MDAGGFLYLARESVVQFLAQDLPESDHFVLAAVQQPIRASALLDRVAVPAWRSKPCWYGIAREDRMISPALQQRWATRMNARISVLNSGHMPFLSQPKETAAVILAAFDFVRGSNPPGGSIVEPRDRA